MGHDSDFSITIRISTFLNQDASTFKMTVSPLMTVAEIKNSPIMRNFFLESNVELHLDRLSAVRFGRVCDDSAVVSTLELVEHGEFCFMYKPVSTPKVVPSPVATPVTTATASGSGESNISVSDFEPDIWQCGVFSCAPVAPALSTENREKAIMMLASVGNEARTATSADNFEVSPNVSYLPDILNGVPVSPASFPEVNQPPKPMATLSQFITQASALVNPETAGPVLTNFLHATTSICNVLDGKTTNTTIETTFKELLRELLAMQSKISSRNELEALLRPVTQEIQQAEPIIKAMNDEFNRIMTGDGLGIWEHMEQMCKEYDKYLQLLSNRTSLVIEYSTKYKGFEDPSDDIRAYLAKVDQVETDLRTCTSTCQAYLQRLRSNRHIFDTASADALAQNHDLEEQVKSELNIRINSASVNVIRLLEVLRDEMQRATEIKILEEKLKQIQQTRADIIAHTDASHKIVEDTQSILERKALDNDLCISQVQSFHTAASDATSKLTDTVAERKTELLEYQLRDATTAASAAGGAYSVARRGKISSTQESQRYNSELQHLETRLAYYKAIQDFSGMAEKSARITEILTKVGPCATRVSFYTDKATKYDENWHKQRDTVQRYATELGWLAPTDAARPGVVVSRRDAQGNLETVVDLIHPEYALQLEEESRIRTAAELLAKAQNTTLSLEQ